VTANDADDRAMLKRFGLFGPPGIILFDRGGKEIADGRVIGYQDSAKFLGSLGKLR
jgi:thiol:disulfide interchange protein DsbD